MSFLEALTRHAYVPLFLAAYLAYRSRGPGRILGIGLALVALQSMLWTVGFRLRV